MSFSVPRNVPDFGNSQRGFENGSWGSSGLPRQNGYTRTGIGGKLDGFLDKRQLPMYKDKPYSYAASRRIKHWYLQKRFLVGLLLGIFVITYWLGLFSSTTKIKPTNDTRQRLWNWPARSRTKYVDWNVRRNEVKEAFILSWDGYEQHAWGMLVQS